MSLMLIHYKHYKQHRPYIQKLIQLYSIQYDCLNHLIHFWYDQEDMKIHHHYSQHTLGNECALQIA